MKDNQVFILLQFEEHGDLAFAPPVGFEEPADQRILRPDLQLVPDVFAVAVPQFLAGEDAPPRPPQQPSQAEPQPVIQPDERFGALPNDVARGVVVAIRDPGGSLGGFFDARAKVHHEGGCPVWLPVERVEFDAGQSQPRRQRPGERGFSRAGGADDGDALIGEGGVHFLHCTGKRLF